MIEFEAEWADAPERSIDGKSIAWGRGLLKVFGRPVWFRGSEKQPEPIPWSWMELLEFLASKWPYITSEQAYPLGLTPSEPWSLRGELNKRWNRHDFSEEQKDREDEDVFRFESRHDLARGLRGLSLPSVYIVREGPYAWVASSEARLIPFDDVEVALETIGNTIAHRLSEGRQDERVSAVLKAWATRSVVPRALLIRLATGLPKSAFEDGLPSHLEFWELEATPGADSEIAAAARMMGGGSTDLSDFKRIADKIRSIPLTDTTKLDELSAKLKPILDSRAGKDPFEQGYTLANHARTSVGLPDEGKIEPETAIKNLGVPIIEMSLAPFIDAVGCWGPKHGPAIVLNVLATRAGTQWGRRATLAHELCHLVVDRNRSLPLAEVLGGGTPYPAERRANAFAAELLLPRWQAWQAYVAHRDIRAALDALQSTFGVGRVLAANQLKNYPQADFSVAERDALEHIVENGSVLDGN